MSILNRLHNTDFFNIFKLITGLNYLVYKPCAGNSKYSSAGLLMLIVQIVVNVFVSYNREILHDLALAEFNGKLFFTALIGMIIIFMGFPIFTLVGVFFQWRSKCRVVKYIERLREYFNIADAKDDQRKIGVAMRRSRLKACFYIGFVAIVTILHNHLFDVNTYNLVAICKVYSMVFLRFMYSVAILEVCLYLDELRLSFECFQKILNKITEPIGSKRDILVYLDSNVDNMRLRKTTLL